MPWRGPEEPGEFPTLGYHVADQIEELCVVPDGDHLGERFLLTEEMLRFLLWHYRLQPAARPEHRSRAFVYRRSQLVRPQKWGKGPFSASMICIEGAGEVLFDGWDASGEPVARPWPTPWIQVTAVSEDQTDNVWRALKPMIEEGPLAEILYDTGDTRIKLPGGGWIEPVTASAKSRLGQRITFAVQDETHSWLKANGGHRLADNQRRNLAGMGGRSIETTNAWDPAEQSVAQNTAEVKVDDVHRDYPDPPAGSIRNKRHRRQVLKSVYGDSWWVDLNRIDAEIEELLPRDPAQAERFFLNRVISGEAQAFDVGTWRTLARPRLRVPKGTAITVGFDGSRFKDSTGFVCTVIDSGFQFVGGVWERPEHAPDDWEVPEDEVDDVAIDLFDRYDVVRLYGDPPYWESLLAKWSSRWPKRVSEWWTSRQRAMALACGAYRVAQGTGELTHDDNPRFAEHIANSRKRNTNMRADDGSTLWMIDKERRGSPLKIDLAVCGVLSWKARLDAITAGEDKKRKRTTAGFGGRRR